MGLIFSCKQEEELLLQVPAPNWEDQVIYFLMIDRFADGNMENNDLGTDEYDPTDDRKFQGGDFVGIQNNLDYFKELGTDAIWFTPPVSNQWWNPDTNFTGYHGYWATHFMETDPHYGTLEELKNLSDAAHRKGMYLIQDIVVNHTGDFFDYEGGYEAKSPTKYYINSGAPVQAPFDLNDPNNPEHLKAEIYNFTPPINNYQDESQKMTYQMGNLDDLNTTNPVVRKKLLEAYRFWVKEAGIDGFRFDTPIYVEHDFYHFFMHEGMEDLKGIEGLAKDLGRDFYSFGETWIPERPFEEKSTKKIKAYLGTAEKPEFDGILNFPLQQGIERVFASGEPTAQLAFRLRNMQKHFPKPIQRVNFIDNHDMARFRTAASEAAYQQAMLLLMSVPGVPVIWQGTEQGCLKMRGQMFDLLDTNSEEFQFVKKLIAFRKSEASTRRGQIEILADSKTCPGLLLIKLKHSEKDLYLAFNNLEEPILTSDIALNLENPTPMKLKMELELVEGTQASVHAGALDFLQLPPKAGMVFSLQKAEETNYVEKDKPSIQEKDNQTIKTASLALTGTSPKADSVFVLVDGNEAQKFPLSPKNNQWKTNLNLQNLGNGNHFIQVVAYIGDEIALSKKWNFQLNLPEQLYIAKNDPIGDDLGPKGTYLYPIHETFSRQMDMQKASIHTIGNNFRLDIEMAEPLSTVWNPANGFDHVQFNIFIDLPKQEGAKVLPNINTNMPENANWDYYATVAGWNVGLYDANGATATTTGAVMSKKPMVTAVSSENKIQIYFPATAIGRPSTLEGMKVFICTWDGGGANNMRPLEEKPAAFIFGGYEEGLPVWMDEVWVEGS